MKKTVLVTGGTVRLGKCIADYLRKKGWKVLTTSHRLDSDADFYFDFSNKDSALWLTEELKERLDRPLDALVNNASCYYEKSTNDEMDLEDVEEKIKCMNVNSLTPELLSEYVMNLGTNCVVNILDAQVLDPDSFESSNVYASSKYLFKKITYDLARRFAPDCRINAVAPGCVLPPVGKHVKAAKKLLRNPPTAEDVAKAVAFLLDNESITGVVLPVDSGLVSRVRWEENDDKVSKKASIKKGNKK